MESSLNLFYQAVMFLHTSFKVRLYRFKHC